VARGKQPVNGESGPAAASGAADDGVFRFRMTHFRAPDRFEAWREIIGRALMKVRIEQLRGERYFGDLTLRALPELCVSSGMMGGMKLGRPASLIDNDDLVMSVSLSGDFYGHQRDLKLGKGQAVLLSSAQTGLVSLRDERFLIFRMPLRAMSPMVGNLDRVLARPIPCDNEALRLLVGYADTLRKMTALTSPDSRRAAATHIHDLVALAVGATRDATEVANGRGLRAARLAAMKADIAGQLGSASLSIDAIAKRHRVSPRYIQLLFEGEGTTYSGFVLESRLFHAYRILTDPRLARRPIISVAFDSGFQDLSYFNRTFRRRFGTTPSEVRAAAQD